MSAITSYSQVPQTALTDGQGNITHHWQLFFSNLASGVLSKLRQVPVNGFSFTIPNGINNLVLDPAGTLASGTIIMPASAVDGQIVSIITSQSITSVTISGNSGQTIVNAPTTLTTTGCSFIFDRTAATWYRKT